MKVPKTKIRISDLPPAELDELMPALCSAIPGSAWFAEMHHRDGCTVPQGYCDAVACTCDLVDVDIQRLQPEEALEKVAEIVVAPDADTDPEAA